MRAVKTLLIVLVVLVAVVVAAGLMMPSQYRVERTAVINAPADKIYGFIADPREWKKWSVWNQRDPDMKITYSGSPAGAGAKWAWESKSEGSGNMTFTRAEPGRGIEYELAFPDMGMSSRGALTLGPEGSGTKVSWTNDGDVGKNPVMRLFVPFMDGMVGPDFAAGLANLKTLAEKAG